MIRHLLPPACLLAACASTQHVEEWRTLRVKVVSERDYSEPVSRAAEYLKQAGVRMEQVSEGEDVELRLRPAGLRAVMGARGWAEICGRVAVAFIGPSTAYAATVIAHELGHALGAQHSWRGIMFPEADFASLASGFSAESIEEMKQCREPR